MRSFLQRCRKATIGIIFAFLHKNTKGAKMKILGKIEMIAMLKEKIAQAKNSGDTEVKKLQKLLDKLIRSNDVSYI